MMQIKQNTWRSWLVCIAAGLSMLYCFVQMTQFNALSHDVMTNLHLGFAKFSMLPSLYFLANVIFLLPAGILIDRFSKKNILLISLVVSIVCLLIFSCWHNFIIFSLCSFVLGICGAFAFITPLSLLANWFIHKKMALVSGIMITMGLFGAVISNAPLTYLINLIGWQDALQFNALFGGLIFIITLLVVQDCPSGMTRVKSPLKLYGITQIIKNRQNWLFGSYASLINLVIMIFGAAFGISYLKYVFHVTESQAALSNSLLFIGAMIGPPIFGWLSDKLGKRKLPMYLGAVSSLIVMLILMCVTSLNLVLIDVLFFMLGVFTSAQVIAYPAILESNSIVHGALGLSICSTLIMAGAAIAIPLFGWLLDLHGIGGTIAHSASDYKFALWVVPLAFVIGLILLFFGKETRCQQAV